VDDVIFACNRPGKGEASRVYTHSEWLTRGQHGFDTTANTAYAQGDSPDTIRYDTMDYINVRPKADE